MKMINNTVWMGEKVHEEEGNLWISDKFCELLKEKKEEGFELSKASIGVDGNLHTVFYRHFNDTHVVWTAYINDKEETSLCGFYNGAYDYPSLSEAVTELDRRRS